MSYVHSPRRAAEPGGVRRAAGLHPDLIRRLVALGLIEAAPRRGGRALVLPERARRGGPDAAPARGLRAQLRGHRAGHRPARPDRDTRSGPTRRPAPRKVNMDPSHLTQKSAGSAPRRADQGAPLRAHRGRRRAPAAGAARPGRGHRSPAAEPGRRRSGPAANGAGGRAARRPRVSGPGVSPGQVHVTQRLSRLLDAAEQEANRLKDEYVSVEHLLLALLAEGPATAAGRLLQARPDPGRLPGGADQDPRQPAGHLGHAGGGLRGAGQVRPGPGRRRGQRQARPGHRPGRRDQACHPDPVPQDQEQPGPGRRPGRGQDRDRGGPGPADQQR